MGECISRDDGVTVAGGGGDGGGVSPGPPHPPDQPAPGGHPAPPPPPGSGVPARQPCPQLEHCQQGSTTALRGTSTSLLFCRTELSQVWVDGVTYNGTSKLFVDGGKERRRQWIHRVGPALPAGRVAVSGAGGAGRAGRGAGGPVPGRVPAGLERPAHAPHPARRNRLAAIARSLRGSRQRERGLAQCTMHISRWTLLFSVHERG